MWKKTERAFDVMRERNRRYLEEKKKEEAEKQQRKDGEVSDGSDVSEEQRIAAEKLRAYREANGLDPDAEILKHLYDDIAEEVAVELELIEAADGIEYSPLFADYEDYSQYKPRGYYEGDEDLERYFKAMMWYGRRNFPQNNEAADACALLMCLALSGGPEDTWKAIYDITSFFAGRSDDSGFEEYFPLIQEAYGGIPAADELSENTDAFNEFHRLTGELESPAINSVPMADDEGETVTTDAAKGFRFMGQRFSLDASIFQQLCYSVVKENEAGDKRLLPDGLDIPAALGSDEALAILNESGKTDYPNYAEQMEIVRSMNGSIHCCRSLKRREKAIPFSCRARHGPGDPWKDTWEAGRS